MKTGGGRGALRFILLLVFLHLDKNSGANAMEAEKDGGKSWKGPEPAPTLSPPIVFGSEGPSNIDGIQPRTAAMRKLNRNTTVKVTETEVKGQPVGLGLIPIEDESTKSIRHTRSNFGSGSGGNGSRGPSGGTENGRNPNHPHHHFRHQQQQQQHNLYKRAANQPTKVKPATEDLPSKNLKPTSSGSGVTTPLCRNRRGIDERGSYNGSRILGWSANKNRNNNDTNKAAVPDCKFIPEQFFSSDDESKQFAAAGTESKPSAGDFEGREIAASALSAKAEPQEVLAIKNNKDVVTATGKKPPGGGGNGDTKEDPDSETVPVAVNASTTTTVKPNTNTTRRSGAAKFFSANK